MDDDKARCLGHTSLTVLESQISPTPLRSLMPGPTVAIAAVVALMVWTIRKAQRHGKPPALGLQGGIHLKGTGALGAIPGPLQGGYRGPQKRLGGGYWRLEMRLRLVLGYGNAFGVESGLESWGRRGATPLPAISWPPANVHHSSTHILLSSKHRAKSGRSGRSLAGGWGTHSLAGCGH